MDQREVYAMLLHGALIAMGSDHKQGGHLAERAQRAAMLADYALEEYNKRRVDLFFQKEA